MKRYYIFLLLLILPFCAWSQENRAKHELSLSAALMSNFTYETRLSYLYRLNNIVGIGASVGRYKQFHTEKVPQGEVYNKEWNFWQVAEKDKRVTPICNGVSGTYDLRLESNGMAFS